jgi:uncharacterized membrane protein YqaE (UPF0057 family)
VGASDAAAARDDGAPSARNLAARAALAAGVRARRGDSGCHIARRRRPAEDSMMDVIRILVAILVPPLGVFLQVGLGLHFWLNILLTLLGYVPGIIHAVYIIVKR